MPSSCGAADPLSIEGPAFANLEDPTSPNPQRLDPQTAWKPPFPSARAPYLQLARRDQVSPNSETLYVIVLETNSTAGNVKPLDERPQISTSGPAPCPRRSKCQQPGAAGPRLRPRDGGLLEAAPA